MMSMCLGTWGYCTCNDFLYKYTGCAHHPVIEECCTLMVLTGISNGMLPDTALVCAHNCWSQYEPMCKSRNVLEQ